MPYKRNHKWYAQVRKEGQKCERVFLTKKEAVDWEVEMRKKPVSEWSGRTDTVCLNDWAQKYLDFSRPSFSHNTYVEKRSLFKRLFKILDPDMPVSKLKPALLMEYIVEQKEQRSGNASNRDRKNLVAAWNWGMKYMDPPLPGPNPCLVERMPEIRQPRYVPPDEDFWKVYALAEGQDKVMLLAFLHLAARRSEIFRLTWEDIDFANNRVRIWTRKRHGGTYEYDWLPMTKELRKSMRWWWENRPIKDKPHVFLCLDKTEFCRDYLGEPFRYRIHFMRRLCERAGVKVFGFHAIRHFSASLLFKLGYEVAVIQTILRHKSPNTTERYLRSIGLERVREALEDLKPSPARVIKLEERPKKARAAGKKKAV
ncbi:tyrosine-type recombinase/integrase [Desulfatitalea tepidiphila]|uniref:tyrosine-type recombinase/integrase n=1 Tax=Desulfatitalea tepidiphila TaxID=1185843 RepID=UPI0006B654E7|nr:tyrosine-type recombinase/integrase [Desulfatitalea tepidiphila]